MNWPVIICPCDSKSFCTVISSVYKDSVALGLDAPAAIETASEQMLMLHSVFSFSLPGVPGVFNGVFASAVLIICS